MAIDFSDLGGQPLNQQGIDFSDLGGTPVPTNTAPSSLDQVKAGIKQVADSPDIQPFNGINPFTKPKGTPVEQVLGSMRQLYSLPLRFSQTLGMASQPVADYTAEKLGQVGVNPYASAAAAMVAGAAADPRSWVPMGGMSVDHPGELPTEVAEVREARTGVPARQFKALYKDPGAIFAGKNIKGAGQAIGAAKEAAGIDLGVSGNPASLTPENIERINPTKATKIEDINTVIGKINSGQAPSPQEAQNALDSVNSILSQPSVQNNRDVFRQWNIVKTHINNALQNVAPDVRAANQQYARESLGEDFSGLHAVNKNGKPSKLGLIAQTVPAAIGALLGHLIPHLNTLEGTAAGYELGKTIDQLYHAPYVAGLQTAAGAVADRALDPALSATEQIQTSPQVMALVARYMQQQKKNGN